MLSQHTFDPRIFHVSQQDAAVALLHAFRIAFEDVDYFLEEGLVDGVVVPDKDSAILYISIDGDAFIFRRGGFLLGCMRTFGGVIPAVRLLYDKTFLS